MTNTNSTTTPGESTIIERIRKLLALTVNPNPNEAAAAAAKVQEMLDLHNLTMAEVGDWTSKDSKPSIGVNQVTVEYSGKNHPLKRWKESLAQILCYPNCKVFIRGGTHLIFVGETTNVEVIVQLYKWLVSQLEVAAVPGWVEYKHRCLETITHREDPLVFRNSFFVGANDKISDRLNERRAELRKASLASMTSIVLVHSEAVNDYILNNMRIGKTKKFNRPKIDAGSFAQGQVVGSQVNLGESGVLPS